jgi:hypothetical protein
MQLHSDNTQVTRTPRLGVAAGDSRELALTLMDPAHPQRAVAEAFVRAVFAAAYHARLGSFYPLLLSTTRDNGEYAAVAGIRPAGGAALFSEHYLDQPVEQILQTERAGIVEIGNLAPASAGQARWLICTLSAFLIGAGFTHVVFTSVPKLRNAFSRMGLPLAWIAEADQQRLPPQERSEWGSYYDCKPAVYAGDIVAAIPALTRLMHSDPELSRLSQRASRAGQEFARGLNTPAS